jgi:competence protein ComEA
MTKKLFVTACLCLALLLGAPAEVLAESGSAAAPKAAAESGRKVNLNTASVQELIDLPGIGPKTAEKIVAWRQENGKFKKPEDLMAVKGIGEKKFAKLKDLVTVQ